MKNYIKQQKIIENFLRELEKKLEEYKELLKEYKKIEEEGYLIGNIYKRKIRGKEYLYYYVKEGDKTKHKILKNDEIKKLIENYQKLKKIKNKLDKYYLFFNKFLENSGK